MSFERDQPPRPRNRRVVRGRLVQSDTQKIAQRQRVRRTAGDAALGVDALEITDQQQPKIDPRRQSRPAYRLRIKAASLGFGKIVEPVLAQQLIQATIKRLACGRRQVRRRDPHRRLSIAFAFPIAMGEVEV